MGVPSRGEPSSRQAHARPSCGGNQRLAQAHPAPGRLSRRVLGNAGFHLAGQGFHRVQVSLDRVEPVLDAQFDGVDGRRADTCVDLVAELAEIVLEFGFGPTTDAGAVPNLAPSKGAQPS